ncbi:MULTISPECIES: GMC family oxidoreductase [Stenotrophomonas]|uniref:GMC family oxidoreductase n=1 Tax=Stenotrophomonas TaxID=40323 RepID=UPI000D381F0F|nr:MULTISPECIES: GMC family oxidoreductase [Stenotrophomonas]PTT37641.1 choline dehydrogenase [Stenotrophomonas sp. HMWF022]PTS79466.1 choline dehydrogenase [Stenotrophomonas sp. HMWF023]CAH0130002.1 Fructose dehydrogenase large subunit [Stenotrophomonas lactitubi]CAH0130290.1 Fructose dehydrogenase large subunit [Stenotrophomonas lactitubi]CAH0131569.1 Fructose dehydrogenase large subunit [Stenotrophomonas lactitubi]
MKAPVFRDGDADADVVIVGSGVVGALIAHQLVRAGKSVLVLEAGPRLHRSDVVENWRNVSFERRIGSDFQGPYPQSPLATAPLYFPANDYVGLTGPDASSFHQGFIKAVGGTTWHWAASCWRHLPVDFKMQSTYGVGRDWPISYDDIEPYYCRAEEAMGVSGPNDPGKQSPAERSKPYLADMIPWGNGDKVFAEVVNPHGYNLVPIPQGRMITPWNDRPACCGNNNCQPICPIGAMYNGIHTIEAAEKLGAQVLAEAVAYKIDTDAQNRVTAIHWYDNNKVSHKATGRSFVIACNALETPRLLLLAANEQNPNGIANRSDQVGRNMLDHSGFHCSFIADRPIWLGRGPAQSSCMVGPRDGAFRSQYSATKIILNNISRVAIATDQALQKGLVGDALDAEIRRRAIFGVDLSISLEPLPDPSNRLTLSKTRVDGHGLACPDIHYSLGDYARKGYDESCKQLRHIGSLFNAEEFVITTALNANNHIMGSTIMGADPRDSVVDGECRAHDHPNLWLPGGGPMVSASVVNSTLTMAALALRAADAIERAA